MKLGKLNKKYLNHFLLQKLGRTRTNVIKGASFGVDTAIIDLGRDQRLIVSSDPATYIPSLGLKESAWLTVILSANDIATSGLLPQYAQFVLHLSKTISRKDFESYWYYIHEICSDIGIAITGGHTGFDFVENTTLSGGVTMFALGEAKEIKSAAYAVLNDDIILTKTAALSGSAILAKSFPKYVKSNLGLNYYNVLKNSFYDTSVLKEVHVLRNEPSVYQGVNAMHDVTEGGVLVAIYELSYASKLGVKIDKNAIFIDEEQKAICDLFAISPYRTLASGCLLITCDKEYTNAILNLLKNHNIPAGVVGELKPIEEGRKIIDMHNNMQELEYWESDPYWNAFSEALNNQLN